ncbi:MAG: hypothetical protein SW833_21995 [Cyanobacteriota bacterium]|nr:hypothetical protein [Cyanobacteriota bacterium]
MFKQATPILGAAALGAIALTSVSGAKAHAFTFDAGFDFFATPDTPQSFVDIDLGSGNMVSIPLVGNPFGPGNTDTIVERKNGCTLDNDGDSCLVDIEVVAVSHKSDGAVNIQGSLFNVDIISGSLLGQPANPMGQMAVTRTNANGGTIELHGPNSGGPGLPLDFQATFTEVGNPGNSFMVFDSIDFGVGSTPSSLFSINPGPMPAHTPSMPAGGFYAGIDPVTGGKEQWVHVAPGKAHFFVPAMVPEPSAMLALAGFGTMLGLMKKRNSKKS